MRAICFYNSQNGNIGNNIKALIQQKIMWQRSPTRLHSNYMKPSIVLFRVLVTVKTIMTLSYSEIKYYGISLMFPHEKQQCILSKIAPLCSHVMTSAVVECLTQYQLQQIGERNQRMRMFTGHASQVCLILHVSMPMFIGHCGRVS